MGQTNCMDISELIGRRPTRTVCVCACVCGRVCVCVCTCIENNWERSIVDVFLLSSILSPSSVSQLVCVYVCCQKKKHFSGASKADGLLCTWKKQKSIEGRKRH